MQDRSRDLRQLTETGTMDITTAEIIEFLQDEQQEIFGMIRPTDWMYIEAGLTIVEFSDEEIAPE